MFFSFFFSPIGCYPSLCISLEKIIEHLTCYNRGLGFFAGGLRFYLPWGYTIVCISMSLSIWNTLREAKYADFQKHMKRLQTTPHQKMYRLHMQLKKLTQGPYKDILSWLLLINTFLGERIKIHSNYSLQPPKSLLLLCVTSLLSLSLIPCNMTASRWIRLGKVLRTKVILFLASNAIQWIGNSLDNGINPRLHKGRWKFVSFTAHVLHLTF